MQISINKRYKRNKKNAQSNKQRIIVNNEINIIYIWILYKSQNPIEWISSKRLIMEKEEEA